MISGEITEITQFLTFTLGDTFQDFQHLLGTQPARGAFAAGFTLGKFQKVSGYIHHAGFWVRGI